MKKSFFSCFHPLVLETETDQINVDHNKKGLKISRQSNNSKRPISHVLEILLLKASLKTKVSDRNVRQLLLQPKSTTLQRITRHLQMSGDRRVRRDKRIEEGKVLQAERGPEASPSSYKSRNMRSSTLAPSFDCKESSDGSRGVRLLTKPCSCETNPENVKKLPEKLAGSLKNRVGIKLLYYALFRPRGHEFKSHSYRRLFRWRQRLRFGPSLYIKT